MPLMDEAPEEEPSHSRATSPCTSPIAIVGMACRFSGDATGPERLWEMLASGRNGWSEIPESRFATKGLYHPDGERTGSVRSDVRFIILWELSMLIEDLKTNVRGGHFLEEDPALFDAPFFNLPAEVASTLDPQYRLTLELVYEAMESGSDTSVYAGCMVRDYHDTLARDPDLLPRYFMTGNAATMASNRVSHFYDLRGSSMTIDTGCSTTLTALHLAYQNLRAQESSCSVVTGASLMLNPDVFQSMSSIGFLSPDGVSFAFDDRANGYGREEGVAAIILKRLDDAVAAGDPIRAVIRASALNQDGKTPTITTPSQQAQETLMRTCYQQAGLDPGETGYVEAHGTGTPTGDPIELRAIANVIGAADRGNQPLLVGSVKTAIGHTEAASGLASIIKVVLGLEKGLVAPNCNFQSQNKKLDLDGWNIKIPTTTIPWPSKYHVRRASINNFGFGGANAHVIIEQYRPAAADPCFVKHNDFPHTNGTHKTKIDVTVNSISNGTADGTKNGATSSETIARANDVHMGQTNGVTNGLAAENQTNGHEDGKPEFSSLEVGYENGKAAPQELDKVHSSKLSQVSDGAVIHECPRLAIANNHDQTTTGSSTALPATGGHSAPCRRHEDAPVLGCLRHLLRSAAGIIDARARRDGTFERGYIPLPSRANAELRAFQTRWKVFNDLAYAHAAARDASVPIVQMYEATQSGQMTWDQLLQTLDESLYANLGDVQERIRAEGQLAHDKDRVDSYVRRDSTYLAACVLESSRLKPLAAFSVPQAAPTAREVDGYVIPAGTNFIIDSYALNIYSDTSAPDNTTYRPDRFLGRRGSELRDSFWRMVSVALPLVGVAKLTVSYSHVGHFALSLGFLPLLEQATRAQDSDVRVVTLSSIITTNMVPEDLAFGFASPTFLDEHRPSLRSSGNALRALAFKVDMPRYCMAKMTNVLFAQELQRRLDTSGLSILSLSLHPGGVGSDGAMAIFTTLVKPLVWLIAWTTDKGAVTSLFAATAKTVREKADEFKGKFLLPFGEIGPLHSVTKNEVQVKGLWENTLRAVNMYHAQNALEPLQDV
ncbi:hypothetical protein S7711_06677 [Stachybotrys chartarum IBT 7711]|uniref:Ketosynthase family 3 (KS3) domain-containing protein n=1 Tax=Stachybotrys chartarum (strain CBS 109288 / IBT 7711) TaxID=1280523 RepID=A0A084BB51_STACB|nr:hypothetical protein S7711_06677 [Stachybotrys chartarum IBT 7711]